MSGIEERLKEQRKQLIIELQEIIPRLATHLVE